MSQFWVGDGIGRVMGPASLQAIKQLIERGRLQGLTRASTDGRSWKPITDFPEINALLSVGSKAPTNTLLEQEARRIAGEVARLRGLPLHAQLGVPASASVEACRAAFFTKVRPFHPSRLPPDATPALRSAWSEMFELLRSALVGIENAAEPIRAAAPPSTVKPTFAASEFVGWRREGDEVKIDLDLTIADGLLFTDAANGGFFLPTRQALPLFQIVEICLRFTSPTREIKGRGRVVADKTQMNPAGLGIRFLSLGDEDKRFLQYVVKKAQLAG